MEKLLLPKPLYKMVTTHLMHILPLPHICPPMYPLDCVASSRPSVLFMLVVAGADVNCRSKGGKSALHGAATFENAEVSKILIDAGNCFLSFTFKDSIY